MSNLSVIHLTVDCHVWTVCSDGFDNTNMSTQLRCVILVFQVPTLIELESKAVPPELDMENSSTMINPVSCCAISSESCQVGEGDDVVC